jgi:hypothetical protein
MPPAESTANYLVTEAYANDLLLLLNNAKPNNPSNAAITLPSANLQTGPWD